MTLRHRLSNSYPAEFIDLRGMQGRPTRGRIPGSARILVPDIKAASLFQIVLGPDFGAEQSQRTFLDQFPTANAGRGDERSRGLDLPNWRAVNLAFLIDLHNKKTHLLVSRIFIARRKRSSRLIKKEKCRLLFRRHLKHLNRNHLKLKRESLQVSYVVSDLYECNGKLQECEQAIIVFCKKPMRTQPS